MPDREPRPEPAAVVKRLGHGEQLPALGAGQGKHGEKGSEFAANTTLGLLEADNAALRGAPAARLRKVLRKVDALLKKNDEINAELSGTNAVVAYLKGSTL